MVLRIINFVKMKDSIRANWIGKCGREIKQLQQMSRSHLTMQKQPLEDQQ